MSLLSTLGLPPPLARAAADTAPSAAPPLRPAAKRRAEPEVTLGGAQIVSQTLGPEVPGPRRNALMALLAADGSGPLQRSNSSLGGQINRNGHEAATTFLRLEGLRRGAYELWNDAQQRSKRSADIVARLEQAARAIGQHSRSRGGSYVREHSEAYVKAQRALEEDLDELPSRQQAYDAAVSATNVVRIRQQKLLATRNVAKLGDDVAAEKKRIEDFKSTLTGIFDVAVKVVKQDWAGLAEDAGKFLVGQFADALPTTRLDELKQQLEAATAHLKNLEDGELLAELVTATANLRKASIDLENGRKKVYNAVSDLRLAAKTAVEALGESAATADAAKALKGRSELIDIMARGRVMLGQFVIQADALTKQFQSLASMTRGYPGIVRSTPDLAKTTPHR